MSDTGGRDAHPGCLELFRAFLLLGLSGFGGVLPLARHTLVERRGWLSESEFGELLGVCQFLPGGNVINLSVAVGLRFRGLRGAAAAIIGLLAAPAAIVVIAGAVYDRYAADPVVRRMFAGIAAGAGGLLLGLTWRMGKALWPGTRALLLAGVTMAAVAAFRLPLLVTLLVMLPLSVAVMRDGSAGSPR